MMYDFDRIIADKIIVECRSVDEQWSFVNDMYASCLEIVAPLCKDDPSDYVHETRPYYRVDKHSKMMKIGSRYDYNDRIREGYVIVPLPEIIVGDDIVPSSQSIHAFIG